MKELFIEAHDELIEEYLEDHPEATEQEAILATSDEAYDRMTDKYADMVDRARQMHKDGKFEAGQ